MNILRFQPPFWPDEFCGLQCVWRRDTMDKEAAAAGIRYRNTDPYSHLHRFLTFLASKREFPRTGESMDKSIYAQVYPGKEVSKNRSIQG